MRTTEYFLALCLLGANATVLPPLAQADSRQYDHLLDITYDNQTQSLFAGGNTTGRLGDDDHQGVTDGWLARIDRFGNELWRKQFGSEHGESVNDIVSDGAGNITATGYFLDDSRKTDIWAARFTSDGTEIWRRQIRELSGHTSALQPGDVALDSKQNLIISGTITRPNGDRDIVVFKLGPDGNIVWERTLGTEQDDANYALAVDGQDNIFLTGHTLGTLDLDFNPKEKDAWLAKLDTQGPCAGYGNGETATRILPRISPSIPPLAMPW